MSKDYKVEWRGLDDTRLDGEKRLSMMIELLKNQQRRTRMKLLLSFALFNVQIVLFFLTNIFIFDVFSVIIQLGLSLLVWLFAMQEHSESRMLSDMIDMRTNLVKEK